ncbi:MAG: hypothetical protein OEM52_09355, partial [bacterium]|nr:hypothetical protein [bacterium]
MRNKDWIFWVATGNFALALILFATTNNQLWLFLLVGSYLLRTTVASLNIDRKRIDERQMTIHYRSGNIAYGVTNTTALLLAAYYLVQQDTRWLAFFLVVAIGVLARALFVMVIAKDFHPNLLQNIRFSIHAAFTYFRKQLDEWQLSVHYRSGNFAFAMVMLSTIVSALYFASTNDHTWEMCNVVVLVGLTTKALFNVLLVKNYREGASRVITTVGLMMMLFSSLELSGSLQANGFQLELFFEMIPSAALIAIGLLSKIIPRVVGIFIFMMTAGLLFIILGRGISIG